MRPSFNINNVLILILKIYFQEAIWQPVIWKKKILKKLMKFQMKQLKFIMNVISIRDPLKILLKFLKKSLEFMSYKRIMIQQQKHQKDLYQKIKLEE